MVTKKVFHAEDQEQNEGSGVTVKNYKAGLINQQWFIKYVDTIEEEQTEGFAKDYGMIIGKPFKLYADNMLEKGWWVEDNDLVLTRDNLDERRPIYQETNTWFFDMKTKTLRNTAKKYKDTHVLTFNPYAVLKK